MAQALLPKFESECFFIAPIGAEGSPERKRSDGVLKYIVERAADEMGLKAVRADQWTEPGQITLQVVEHVLNAKAAVADLTGLNPNVFYELAIRHTARLPVVLIAEKGSHLPFDIAQMRTIFFDHTDLASADECRVTIVQHLREAIDGGAVDSPIATTVDIRALQSGSLVERNVAELVTAMEELGSSQRSMRRILETSIDHALIFPRVAEGALMDLVERYDQLQRIATRGESDSELVEAIRGLERPLQYISERMGPFRRRPRPRPPSEVDGESQQPSTSGGK